MISPCRGAVAARQPALDFACDRIRKAYAQPDMFVSKPKPEEIEGSPERAADRGQPFGFGAFNEPIATGKPYLGDPEVVEGIVRGLLQKAHDVAGTEGSFQQVVGEVEKTVAIFYGKDDAYQPMPFNSPDQLGRFVNEQIGTQEDEDKTVEMLLWNLIQQMMEARNDFAEDKITPEDVQFRIDAAVEDAVRILLGLPLENVD